MTNALGVISMFYSRPFTAADFPCLARIEAAGLDFFELLVPEPRELDLAATRTALDAAGLDIVLAARITPAREAHGVTLALEPLNRFETDILNTTRQGLELVRRVASPRVGLMLDTFHMSMEEKSIPAAIRSAGDHLVHFQANENDRGFVGTGSVDWPAVAAALGDIAYAGPITLEPFRRDDERVAVPLAQWRPPERDQNADLARSAAYLRACLEARP